MKIVDFIKKNKLYIIIMFIGILAFFIQLHYVGYSADDYTFGSISKNQGISGIIQKVKSYYLEWSGVLCLFTLLIEWGNIILWKLANCAMVTIIIVLSVKMISHSSKIKKEIIAIVLWICFYILNIKISREVLYWLNGNTAYMYTLFKSIIYFYYLYSRLIMKTKKKKFDLFLLPLTALWAGWSSPQTGVISVLAPILLIIWCKYVKNEKIEKTYWISAVFSLIGFMFLYFAPGNTARMSQIQDFSKLSIFGKFLYRIDDIFNIFFSEVGFGTSSFYLQLCFALISIITLYFCSKKYDKKSMLLKICSYYILLVSLFILLSKTNVYMSDTINNWFFQFGDLSNFSNIGIKMVMPYFLCTIYLICGCVLSLFLSFRQRNPIVTTMIIFALISQLSMTMAPFGDSRTFFCMIVYLSISIAYLIKICYENKIEISGIIIVILSIHNIFFGIVSTCLLILVKQLFNEKEKIRVEFIFCLIIFIMICTPKYIETLEKYRENKIVYDENVNRILSVKKHNENNSDKIKEIKLLMPTNPEYSYMPMVGYEWLENDIKRFYNIDLNITFKEDTEVVNFEELK